MFKVKPSKLFFDETSENELFMNKPWTEEKLSTLIWFLKKIKEVLKNRCQTDQDHV